MTLPTWAGPSSFSYSGTVATGTEILYGGGFKASITAEQYSQLLSHFNKREVSIGTSRTTPPSGSVGQWLKQNVTLTAIASYVGPILLHERYAKVGARPDKIRFF